jgi:hypothetical protein
VVVLVQDLPDFPGEVPHGSVLARSDQAAKMTNHPRDVVEHALAHRIGDKVEQAYARGDLFRKRRKLMEE